MQTSRDQTTLPSLQARRFVCSAAKAAASAVSAGAHFGDVRWCRECAFAPGPVRQSRDYVEHSGSVRSRTRGGGGERRMLHFLAQQSANLNQFSTSQQGLSV